MSKKIAVIVGSLRKDSWNRKIALEMMKLAPASLSMEIVDIGQLPHYNQDLDDNPHKEWSAFRDKIKSSDGVLFITPEYNRSVPGVLKNALDIGSRPYGQSVWNDKPAAVVSVSIGGISGFGANHHLRQPLAYLNMPCMQQPEAYLGNVANLFDSEGKQMTNESTRDFLSKYMEAYEKWVHKILA